VTRTGESVDPEPLISDSGSPSRCASAAARVSVATPPSVGALAMVALPASIWTSIACISTLIG